ncbi:MAG: hypothetical protein H9W81_13470 [Enterococcus sp.]|nr:hypothetical protein [Enterococcus sp.]
MENHINNGDAKNLAPYVIPVIDEGEETIMWDTTASLAVLGIEKPESGTSLGRRNVLEHCRRYPEQWEVLEPDPTKALSALRDVYQMIDTQNVGSGTGEATKSIMLILPESVMLEDGARAMIEKIARMGRSRQVHLLLEVSTVDSTFV